MKALTFQQPYASAALSVKQIDNRKQTPPINQIGQRFAVHAGGTYDHGDLWRLHTPLRLAGLELGPTMPLGAILGTVLLKGAVEVASHGRALPPGEYKRVFYLTHEEADIATRSPWRAADARWLLVLSEPLWCSSPIPWKGSQGWWNVPDDIQVLIGRALMPRGARPEAPF